MYFIFDKKKEVLEFAPLKHIPVTKYNNNDDDYAVLTNFINDDDKEQLYLLRNYLVNFNIDNGIGLLMHHKYT